MNHNVLPEVGDGCLNGQVPDTLLAGLSDPDKAVRAEAMHGLAAIGRPAVPACIALLQDGDWKVRDLRALRRDKIGFVFQAPYLIPFLDATDNVALPAMLAGVRNDDARARALELLTALDVQHRARAMPAQLSGGEQQRVAIARGLVNRPPVILADEPTGSLDFATGAKIMELMFDLNREQGTTLVLVTHDEALAALAADKEQK